MVAGSDTWGIRRLEWPDGPGEMTASCESDAGRTMPGWSSGNGREFAGSLKTERFQFSGGALRPQSRTLRWRSAAFFDHGWRAGGVGAQPARISPRRRLTAWRFGLGVSPSQSGRRSSLLSRPPQSPARTFPDCHPAHRLRRRREGSSWSRRPGPPASPST